MRRIVLLFVLLCLSLASFAQDAPKPRPRIGVALSGGGARGLAHIGVLQWMDEHHVPVDYVAGTSMGGLMGSLYATGMSPQEMKDFVLGIDWDSSFQVTPQYDSLAFRRKEDRRANQTSIALGLRRGLSGPNGFLSAQGVTKILDRVALPYSSTASFDDLPTPFRCVATDLLKAETVVLSKGSLAESLRATMSVPGVFAPVEVDGRVLVDGGLLKNIPTDVARKMGADVVIAVDIATPLGGRENLQSIFGVMDQSVTVMTYGNDLRDLQQADIIVAPDLGAYTRDDYNAAEKLIQMGYDGAAGKAAVLSRFALNDAEWKEYIAARGSRKRPSGFAPQQLVVTGASELAAEHIEARLDKYVGQPVDTKKLEKDLDKIVGDGRFESIGYEGLLQNGRPALLIHAKEKEYGPPFLDFSFNVDGSDVNTIDFSAGARLTYMDAGAYNAEWRTDVRLGSSSLIASEYYLPIAGSRFFAAPRLFYSKRSRSTYLGDTRTSQFRDQRTGAGFDLGAQISRHSELRVGYQVSRLDWKVVVGPPLGSLIDGKESLARVRWIYDGQDSPIVPRRGLRFTVEGRHLFEVPAAKDQFNQGQFDASWFIPVSSKGSVFLGAAGGTTFDKAAAPAEQFSLGGPFRLGAYGRDQFQGSHFVLTNFGYLRDIKQLPPWLGNRLYAGAWYEFGSAYQTLDLARFRHSYSAGLVLETRLGPLALAGSVSENGRGKIYFSIGRFF